MSDNNNPTIAVDAPVKKRKKPSISKTINKVFGKTRDKSKRSSSIMSTQSPLSASSPSSNGSNFSTATPPTPDLPMPDDLDEVETQFLAAIEQLGIKDEEKRKNLIDRYTTPQMKWKMVMDAERSRQALSGKASQPDYYAEMLSNLTIDSVVSQAKQLADEMMHLNVLVRNQPVKWLNELLASDVLHELISALCLINSVSDMNAQLDSIFDFADGVVIVIQSIMNTKDSVMQMLQVPMAMRVLTCTLLSSPATRTKMKSSLLLLLTLFSSFDAEGYNLVIDAFSHAKLLFREKYRFELLVLQLSEISNFDVKFNGLMLLNTMLNYADDVSVRREIQTELINLDTMKKLSDMGVSDSDFLLQMNEFETELKSELSVHFGNSNDPAGLAKLIHTQLGSDKVLLDILNDMLSMSNTSQDESITTDNWTVLSSVVHSLVSNTDSHGRIKDLSEEDSKLRSQIRTFESAMLDMEKKLKVEKQKLMQYIDIGTPVNVSEFDTLKEVVSKVVHLKESAAQAQLLAASATAAANQPLSRPPLPTPPKRGSMTSTAPQDSTEPAVSIAVNTAPVITATPSVDSPVSTGGGTPPPVAPPSPMPNISGGPPAPPTLPPSVTMVGPPPPPAPAMTGGPPPPPPMMGGPPPPPPMMGGPPPPPGLMGGPPPPPGMGGMGGPPMPPGLGPMGAAMNLPKLPTYVPKADLRNFHIESITKNKINNTIFVKSKITEATNDIKLDTTKLEQMFSAKKVVNEASSGNSAQTKTAAQVSLIDPKRAYNIGIQLASMRLTHETIKVAIIQMNNEKLSQNQINILKQICPTEEETEAVCNFEGSIEELAAPDRFFKVLSSIPHLEGRLEAWGFRMRFDDDVASLRPNIESLRLAATELKESKKFAKFLTIVLAISNYLNAKSSKKNSYGFKLGSLHKLRETKTTDNSSNLLQYIIEYIEEHHAELLKFYTDLPDVSIAKKIGISQIKDTISNMKRETAKLAKTIAQYEAVTSLDTEDCFLKIMKPFHSKAAEALQNAEEKFETLTKQLEELATLFDEDKMTMTNKPEDFFANVDTFFEMYQSSMQQLEERRKKEEEKRKKDAARSGSLLAAAASPPRKLSVREAITKVKGSSPTTIPGPNEGLLSDLKANMRSGQIFAKRRSFRMSSVDLDTHFKEMSKNANQQ